MATGLENKLTGQIGECLACVELGRRGLIATSFTGNVPEYDLLICNTDLKTLPIQVKTTRSNTWPGNARKWLSIDIDHEEKQQINNGPKEIEFPDLIYISISLRKDLCSDRFFICTKKQIQEAFIQSYVSWMEPKDWKRPKNYESLDNRCDIKYLEKYENNWQLIFDRLQES